MIYYFSKYKFTTGIFYKTIDTAVIEHLNGCFKVTILPFFRYSGNYYIDSITEKDSKRNIYLTMKSEDNNSDLSLIDNFNKVYISLSFDGKKIMIFDSQMNGIILKK